jgi:hypothetical protein
MTERRHNLVDVADRSPGLRSRVSANTSSHMRLRAGMNRALAHGGEMTQAQASSARTRVGLGPSVPTAPREIHPAALKRQAVGRAGSLALSPLLSEKRREENRRHSDADGDLLCECGIPNCRETVPAVAAYHRGTKDCFIVTPNHVNGDTPVGVADQFFVIRTRRSC